MRNYTARLIVNRFVAKNDYRNPIANRLALATFFLLFFITSSLHSQIPAYVPTNGLVGYWPFNGNANDESGNGNHGIIADLNEGQISFETDRNNNTSNSVFFNNPGDWNAGGAKIIITSSLQNFYNGNFTIQYWAKPTNSSTPCELLNRGYDSSGGLGIRYGGGTGVGFYSNFSGLSISSTNYNFYNSWNHYCFVINGNETFLYFNGQLIGVGNYNSPNIQVNEIWLGKHNEMGLGNGSTYAFIGYLDDLSIYNRALTQEEITALYNGTTAISGCTNNTACNYNSSATQDDGSCIYPAQTYLNCAGTCINDADNDGTCDELETPTLPSYLPSNGLVGYWPFNGNANDESGNGNNGTVNGATLTADRNGNIQSAMSFNRLNSNYITSSISNLPLNNSSRTITSWVKWSGQNLLNAMHIANYGAVNNTGDSFGLMIFSGNNWHSYSHINDLNGNISANNNWHFVVTSYENQNIRKLYLDGLLIGQDNVNLSTLNSNFVIGGSPDLSNTNFFDGQLDDIAIYNRALTQEEITALYNGTTSGGGGGNGGTAGTPAPSVPQGIPYQAMIRDNNGAALVNTPVTVRFSLRQDVVDGTVEYQETHNLTTNAFGLINTHFGSGTATQSTFANINWSNTTKFIQVEANTGSGFVEMGTQQMMSVPFALQSNKATMIKNAGLPVFANNTAALAGGLVAGDMYRTAAGVLMVVY